MDYGKNWGFYLQKGSCGGLWAEEVGPDSGDHRRPLVASLGRTDGEAREFEPEGGPRVQGTRIQAAERGEVGGAGTPLGAADTLVPHAGLLHLL